MVTDTKTCLAPILRSWAADRTTNEVARLLQTHWATAQSWMNGTTIPRRRDLPAIAAATGLPLEQLTELAAADRAARSVGIPIDTPEQARAWVDQHQTGEGG